MLNPRASVPLEFTNVLSPLPSPPSTLNRSQGGPYSDDEIRAKVSHCPKLASLESINQKLAGLVNADRSFNSQIAETIRRDPSLTARLLRMVNSVYFGLSAKVNNIEEAVLYLGLRQIRELSMATPVIEDMERISDKLPKLPWRELWQHSIGSAIMTREILSMTDMLIDDDTDYIIGLLHNVGKVVAATAFPAEFEQLARRSYASPAEVCAAEQETIGWDHAAMGGYYLECHKLAPEIVEAVRYHADPTKADQVSIYAAAVHVADLQVREAGIHGGLEIIDAPPSETWAESAAWHMLFGHDEGAASIVRGNLEAILVRLPSKLSSLV
jgi:HD-like signal output (HDOD) protein